LTHKVATLQQAEENKAIENSQEKMRSSKKNGEEDEG
jgi:hypothetical protein